MSLDLPPEGTLEWAEEIYMNGFADDVSGDAEAPTGHFYRVERWIVTTDNQGFKELDEFATVEEAINAFSNIEDEYAMWAEGEDDELF